MSTETNATQIEARRSDGILASIMIVIALGALWFSRDMSMMASVFPRTIAILLLIFSIALLARVFVTRPQMSKPQPGSVGRRLGLIGVLLLWSFSLKWLGFIVASVLSATALAMLAHYHGWTFKRAVAYGLVLAGIIAFFYTLFAILLNVPLPVGQLWRGL
ncbi:tripartite tricarboxylate transporter TctB family protein [Halomonas sp. GXIMD04776]|uniref:tripartite tricarboxylate transporter TctB family protein n=1 Tax=Halomonas sp. GXIMD04776 TaxID=3415605 RepID=UPI003CBD7B11